MNLPLPSFLSGFNNNNNNKKPKSNVADILTSSKLKFSDMIDYLRNNKLFEKTDYSTENIYRDLEIFTGLDDSETSLLSKINMTSTIFGHLKLINMLNNPVSERDIINQRIDETIKISSIMETDKFNIYKRLDELKELEKDVIWLLRTKTPEEQTILNGVYFGGKLFNNFNNYEEPLNVYSYFKIYLSPLYGILSPLVMMIFPFLYLKFFSKIKINFKVYVKILKMSLFGDVFSMLGTPRTGRSKLSKYFSFFLSIMFYIQNLFNSISISINTNKIITLINNKLANFQKFCRLSISLINDISVTQDNKEIQFPIKYLEQNDFTNAHSLFSNKGKILYAAKNTIQYKSMEELFQSLAHIDYLVSIKKIMDKFDCCYPKLLENKEPVIDLEQFYHPYINKSAVKNNLVIGNNLPKNIIITGPNAGGKSTLIKSLSLSTLFGQTLGICFANRASFTPFKILNSYLNIPDCKGKESLFEAEMHRARDHIKNCETLSLDDKSFIIMDEIFSSTNPDEGISGAFAIAEKLASFSNSICVITTHYNYLTKLENHGSFKNYKIPCNIDNNNTITYPYKIEEGISNQNIALELLKSKGFDEELITNAKHICSKFISNNSNNESN